MTGKSKSARRFPVAFLSVSLFLFGLGFAKAPASFSALDFYGQLSFLTGGILMITISLRLGVYCLKEKMTNWRNFLFTFLAIFLFAAGVGYSLDFWKDLFGGDMSFEQIKQQFWPILVASFLITFSFFLFAKSLNDHA